MPDTRPPPLILASTSRYRRELLQRFGLPFEVESPGVDEAAIPGEAPAQRARRLALEKARAVAGLRPDAWVIGSDQVASLGELLLDKPGDATRSRSQLATLSARQALFHTGAVLLRGADLHEHLDITTVSFRSLSAAEIERYVERERPYDCAGGFKSEGLGVSLFERLCTEDPTALVGLPLIWLATALRAAGYRVP